MESRNSVLDHLMGKELFPFPGVRFNPTDVELVMFFLLRKVMGRKCPVEVIAEVDVYKVSPWDLPGTCESSHIKHFFVLFFIFQLVTLFCFID